MFNLLVKLQKILTCIDVKLIFALKRLVNMKKKILKPTILATFLGASILMFLGNSSGPGGNRTGSPKSAGSCSGCHYSSMLDGSIAVELIDPSTFEVVSGTYVPDKTYTIKVTMTGNSSKMGFQVTSMDGSNVKAGSILNSPANTSVYSASGAEVWGHTSPATNQNTNTWEASFTAPSAGTGKITFYAAGIVANGNGNNSGDEVVTNSFSFEESTTNSVVSVKYDKPNVWLNHNTGQLISDEKLTEVAIWNNQGQLIAKMKNTNSIELKNYPKGIYYINYKSQTSKWNSTAIRW